MRNEGLEVDRADRRLITLVAGMCGEPVVKCDPRLTGPFDEIAPGDKLVGTCKARSRPESRRQAEVFAVVGRFT